MGDPAVRDGARAERDRRLLDVRLSGGVRSYDTEVSRVVSGRVFREGMSGPVVGAFPRGDQVLELGLAPADLLEDRI